MAEGGMIPLSDGQLRQAARLPWYRAWLERSGRTEELRRAGIGGDDVQEAVADAE